MTNKLYLYEMYYNLYIAAGTGMLYGVWASNNRSQTSNFV